MPYGESGCPALAAVSFTGSLRGSPYSVPPDAAYTTLRTPVRVQHSSTFSVPMMFTLASNAGRSRDGRTPAWAPRCITTSGR